MKGRSTELIKCPSGGFHAFQDLWGWDSVGEQEDYIATVCKKCGQEEGETK